MVKIRLHGVLKQLFANTVHLQRDQLGIVGGPNHHGQTYTPSQTLLFPIPVPKTQSPKRN